MKQPNKWQRKRMEHEEDQLKKSRDFITKPFLYSNDKSKYCKYCGEPLGYEGQMDFDDLNTGEKITFHSRCVPYTKYFEIAQESGWTKETLRHENEISKDI